MRKWCVVCALQYARYYYRWIYLKRRSHTDFNSYVLGMERETNDLHSELSLRIRSRARHTVKSRKKERDDGLQAIWYRTITSSFLVCW